MAYHATLYLIMDEEVRNLEIASWTENPKMFALPGGEATVGSIEELFTSTRRSFLCSFNRFSEADKVMAKAIYERKDVFDSLSKYPEVSRWLSCCLCM